MRYRILRPERGGGVVLRAGAARLALLGLTLSAGTGLLLLGTPGAASAEPEATAPRSEMRWTDYDSQPLRVNIWHGREGEEVYRRGEPVEIGFETNQDAYAVVYRIDAEGEVAVLWPRSRYDDGFVFGRHAYTLPAEGAPQLRAGPEEGVEYVEAIVSLYPFDLRDLEVDFVHEDDEQLYRFAVAGDPFLAMNEVNYAITRLEDPEDYVITNYVSYYVDRRVDHPRYMCAQCHTGDEVYDPYDDSCLIAIHHDYGWDNRWYVRFGWYPVYYYPAYYYVDPWSYRPWINYWYTPWYDWPSMYVYTWPYDCYVWRWSPYWRGDAWTRWRSGDRRFVPLDKQRFQVDARARDKRSERSTALVRSPRPPREIERAMETRTKLDRDFAVVREGKETRGGGGFRNVDVANRSRVELRGGTTPAASSPGLRVRDESRGRGGRVLGGAGREATSNEVRARVDRSGERRPVPARSSPEKGDRRGSFRPSGRSSGGDRDANVRPSGREGTERRSVRPVEPRKPGARIWSGGRSGQSPERDVRQTPSRRDPSPGRQAPARVERSGREDRRGSAAPREESRRSQPQVRPSAPDRGAERPASPQRPGGSSPTRSSGGGTRGGPTRGDGRR